MARSRSGRNEFNVIQKIGFELKSPQDDFSYQPDSGSTNGGLLGKQQHGIETDYAASECTVEKHSRTKIRSSIFKSIDEPSYLRLGDADLKDLVSNRLSQHSRLGKIDLEVSVDNGEITIQGKVTYKSLKLLILELVGALPSVIRARNEVKNISLAK